MSYSWQLYLLTSSFILLFSFLVAGDQETTLEPDSLKLVFNMINHGSTTESYMKKKNAISDLRNNNILRDRNTHPILVDIMKTSVINSSDVLPVNLEDVSMSNQTKEHTLNSTVPSAVNEGTRHHSDMPNILPRNTRDLIPDLTLSNSTDIEVNSTITNFKQNTSSNSDVNERIHLIKKNETVLVPLPSNTTSNETLTTSQINVTSTSLPPSVKNPKDKENKTKTETNSKQFKKPSINMKNKPIVINNASIEAIKSDNITEYSTDVPINVNISDNITNLVSWVNGTSKNHSKNITTSSLQKLPEVTGLQTLTIVLIVVLVIALISVITAIGMFSVVLYRRYHWNKPQTFSDKCSNADSTGYIDDSTLKENSEEMYSLDNDSFLNSLEAMTIQNYWADSIRHTKL